MGCSETEYLHWITYNVRHVIHRLSATTTTTTTSSSSSFEIDSRGDEDWLMRIWQLIIWDMAETKIMHAETLSVIILKMHMGGKEISCTQIVGKKYLPIAG